MKEEKNIQLPLLLYENHLLSMLRQMPDNG